MNHFIYFLFISSIITIMKLPITMNGIITIFIIILYHLSLSFNTINPKVKVNTKHRKIYVNNIFIIFFTTLNTRFNQRNNDSNVSNTSSSFITSLLDKVALSSIRYTSFFNSSITPGSFLYTEIDF